MDGEQKGEVTGPQTNRSLTFGEKAVGLNSYMYGNSSVVNNINAIKQKCADLIDHCNDARNATADPDVKRMYSEAITNIQTGQMWAVKAATWS